jgi:hypothetical protein
MIKTAILILALCLPACTKKKVEDQIKVRPEILSEEEIEGLPEI